MATHVVCPICGKSSSLRSFPAGGGTDLVLQTFQSLGRGKGFSVVSRESGMTDPTLVAALKPKLFGLMAAFVAHGHTSADEILASIGVEVPPPTAEARRARESKFHMLESELLLEKHTRAFLEADIADLKHGLQRSLHRWQTTDRERVEANRQLEELRAHADRLIAATREGVESLQRLREELRASTTGQEALTEHARKIRAIVEVVKAMQLPKKSAPAQPPLAQATK